MSENSVLVIAFDGLDKELIEEFDLEHVKQEEYGSIDNKTGMSSIKTSELFASFITGKTREEHGIKGLKKEEHWLPSLIPSKVAQKVRGGYTVKQILRDIAKQGDRQFDKRDLEGDSIFEEIENSKAMYVPGYNPSPFWTKHGTGRDLRDLSMEKRPWGYFWDAHEHTRRKNEIFRPVNKWHDFLMVHIFRPDMHQHCYGDPNLSTYDENKLEELYKDTDDLAEEILEYFSEDYDTIIFMSDHGLPTENGHNENAFYSSNRELFGEEVPKITDFYDKILEIQDARL
ncbi:alkaline phosphatase family protein [Candidatus Nanohalobium constans]|nr:alkaline phosphatase family protein [Candidatus Nanohalobium constans]